MLLGERSSAALIKYKSEQKADGNDVRQTFVWNRLDKDDSALSQRFRLRDLLRVPSSFIVLCLHDCRLLYGTVNTRPDFLAVMHLV